MDNPSNAHEGGSFPTSPHHKRSPRDFNGNVCAMRAVKAFRCTGPDCPDHCCQHWDITLDQSRHAALKHQLAHNERDRVLFQKAVQPLEPTTTQAEEPTRPCAGIRMVPGSGLCPFLQQDRLCEIHHRFGETHLPIICDSFPRKSALLNGRLEITGAFSCPEMVRLYLTEKDATHLEPACGILIPSRPPAQCLDRRDYEDNPYLSHFETCRSALRNLLEDRRFSLASRLFQLAFMADRLTPHFYLTSTGTDEAPFFQILDAMKPQSEQRPGLDQAFKEMQSPAIAGVQLLSGILDATITTQTEDGYQQLLQQVFAQFVPPVGESTLQPERIWALHKARTKHWEPRLGSLLDLYLERYAVNHLYAEWYLHADHLAIYVQNLAIRIAMIRFLLLNHPQLGACEGQPPSRQKEQLLEVAIVVIKEISRTLAHNRPLMVALERDLREGGMQNLEYTVQLIMI